VCISMVARLLFSSYDTKYLLWNIYDRIKIV
jgi:hypothetical protein